MLRAILQSPDTTSTRFEMEEFPSLQAASSGWRACPRVDSGACLVQPMPNPAAARRRASKSPSLQTKMDSPTGPRGTTGSTPMRLARASRCCASKSMSVGFPKGSTEARGRSDWVSSLNGERFPIGGFAASFAENLQLLALPLCLCWGSQTERRDTHCFSFAVVVARNKSPAVVVVVNPEKKENLQRTSRLTS